VVVRWRVLEVPAGSYTIRILGPAGGTKYTVLRSSDAGTVGSDGQFSLTTFQSRLPIPAGGYVGLVPPAFAGPQNLLPAPGSSFQQIDDGADGSSGDFAGYSASSGEALYDADIEPDVDSDGYGDVSQDSCPSSAAIHEGVCPSPLPTPTPTARPQITAFKAVPKSFRVKLRGAVVSSGKAGPQGTKLQLTLSTAAKVAFTIESKLVCKPTQKVAGRCKSGFRKVQAFSRSLPRGASSLPYSGRYKHAGKVKNLKPGPYRVTAVPSNIEGSGTPVRTAFTVLR
jgi:hypothetical protein